MGPRASAIVLERYGQDPNANQVILMNLVELGLVRISPNPDNPEDILLDSRPLQADHWPSTGPRG